MRVLFKACIFLAASFCFFGCSSKKGPIQNQAKTSPSKIQVISTIAMIDDLVGMVGGDRVSHGPLIAGEIDPHSYEIVKGDDEKIGDADLFLYNGLGLEHGASLCNKIDKHPFSLSVGTEIAKRCPNKIISSRGAIDPHLWMDISLWAVAIDPIAEALIKLDPSSELYFRERADRAKEDMQKAHERVLSSLQTVPSAKRYLVTSHDAFGYFTRTYLAEGHERDSDLWRARFAAPEGLAPDGQLSSKDIQMIIDHIALYDIKVVFAESNVSHDSLKKIVFASREKKQNVTFSQKVLYGDAMGSFEDPIMTYLEMIEKNAQSLITEWQRQ